MLQGLNFGKNDLISVVVLRKTEVQPFFSSQAKGHGSLLSVYALLCIDFSSTECFAKK